MHPDGVWRHRRSIRVAIQALTNESSIPQGTARVSVIVTPSATISASVNPSDRGPLVSNCMIDSTLGLCIASAIIPTSWFSEAFGSVSVSYGFLGGDPILLTDALELQPDHQLSADDVPTTVAVDLPSNGILQGASIGVPIVAYSGFPTASWQIVLTVAPPLSIREISTNDYWSSTSSAQSPQTVGVNGILADETATSEDAIDHFEVLATAMINVSVYS